MGVFKFLLCIVFIAGTAGYSACPLVIDTPLLKAMIKKHGSYVAYSLPELEEYLEDMVDLNKAIDDLFGDTLSIIKKGFILRDSVSDSIYLDRNTGIVFPGDDYVFVQLSVLDGSTVPKGRHFCADRSSVYEYITPPNLSSVHIRYGKSAPSKKKMRWNRFP
jgi:hypothetical protein